MEGVCVGLVVWEIGGFGFVSFIGFYVATTSGLLAVMIGFYGATTSGFLVVMIGLGAVFPCFISVKPTYSEGRGKGLLSTWLEVGFGFGEADDTDGTAGITLTTVLIIFSVISITSAIFLIGSYINMTFNVEPYLLLKVNK